MYSFDRPDEHSNPYVKLLVRAVEGDVDVRYFSWAGLVRRPPDVLHVHWPETMVRGSRPWKTRVKSILGICYLLVRPLLGTKVVWTVHNARPHEAEGYLSSRYCRMVQRTCDHQIVINALDSHVGKPDATSLIPHGTFSDWYGTLAEGSEPPAPPVRLLFVGLIRPYKGVPELISAFAEARDAFPMRLTVRGAVDDSGLKQALQEASGGVQDLDLVFGHVDDQSLVRTVGDANLVVLPYRRLQNSGAALLALSLGRAVLLPSVRMAQELQSEFGAEWVYLYEGDLNPDSLLDSVRAFASNSRHGAPDMSGRQWTDAGQAHVTIYQRLAH